jgi:hypothetical protein
MNTNVKTTDNAENNVLFNKQRDTVVLQNLNLTDSDSNDSLAHFMRDYKANIEDNVNSKRGGNVKL